MSVAVSSSIHQILADKGLDHHGQWWQERIAAISADQVEAALAEPPGRYRLERLMALISPAASRYLPAMARQAEELTIRRFGLTVGLYAPLYLSNYCINCCIYCGFNRQSHALRRRLDIEQAVQEARVIRSEGFTDILLVSSHDPGFITVGYLVELAGRLREIFSSISVEVQQLDVDGYRSILGAGIDGVTIYQETYDRDTYKRFHLAGPKSDYDLRLSAPDAIAQAGMRRLGLGVLLGLGDWRIETLALAEHAHYLMTRYWQCHISFSFPRIRPAMGLDEVVFEHLVSDKELVQMILALRLCFGDAGCVLSTREPAWLRDRLIRLGITRMSAGSRTTPGGYCGPTDAVGQFEVADHRSAAEVADVIRRAGREPVWKDWDQAFVCIQ
ncbi:MAG: 2-iminoacetate synthase ThiH [Sedimentisphaerales bacterium]|jgi:2-iminoacetate synthase|nr:2-iminoacetate synthase ThiH [Sedimentisphaerales bacterium]